MPHLASPAISSGTLSLLAGKSALPAWRRGQTLNTWRQISGTAGAGGSQAKAYSGMAERDGKLYVAASDGHGSGHNNRVVGIDLMADVPAWSNIRAASASVQDNAFYYSPDGARAAAHTYWSTEYIKHLGRIMLAGFRYGYPGAFQSTQVDGIDPDAATPTWDAADTWPSTPASGYHGTCYDPTTGTWYSAQVGIGAKWDPKTRIWSVTANPFAGSNLITRSQAWDSLRGHVMALGFGDGDDFTVAGTSFRAHKIAADGVTVTAVTVNASSDYTTLKAEIPVEWSVQYDAQNDRYLAFGAGNIANAGTGATVGRVYVFTWNGSNLDCSILTMGGGNDPPVSATPGAGVNSKFRYIRRLGGFAYVPNDIAENIRFLRTL